MELILSLRPILARADRVQALDQGPARCPDSRGMGGWRWEGLDRHFLSAWNPPAVNSSCFAHFISYFLGEGSQRSQKISDLLRVTKCKSHRSEAHPGEIGFPQPRQTQGSEPC